MRIGTFNLQNLRLRSAGGVPHLDGARDRDTPEEADPETDLRDRKLTARIIARMRADVLALQEVFDAATLDHFHDTLLAEAQVPPYPWRQCPPGNDGRGLDLALMSRVAPLSVTSHAALRPRDLGLAVPDGVPADTPVFRRDCLQAEFPGLTLFLCHFKAPYPDPAAAYPVRRLEAEAVRRLIEARFAGPAAANWLVLGDLNDPWEPADPPATAPLLPPFCADLMARVPEGTRWTYHDAWSGHYGRPDRMLASPALAAAFPDAVPEILREGMGREAGRYRGRHLPGVGHHRPHASDHAAVVVEFAGL
ncbi:endonuclease/exonuclease/phosphatase family protein [Roseovarius salinarum]|uniref:endonuclease/exonuclease/phosphatase family protein n=1 Tax=Roseovarius salinarum TaxID=1981892 RepID=UPI000C31D685|nr:endonuclease/exonuclease/phosphatase family protein [Roseovarius salinarum]